MLRFIICLRDVAENLCLQPREKTLGIAAAPVNWPIGNGSPRSSIFAAHRLEWQPNDGLRLGISEAARYKAEGAEDLVKLIVANGQGHNFWEGFFRCEELVDFAIARAKAGKEARSNARAISRRDMFELRWFAGLDAEYPATIRAVLHADLPKRSVLSRAVHFSNQTHTNRLPGIR
jgi:hypothetical protein